MKKISKNQIILLTLFFILLLPVFLISNKQKKIYRSKANENITPAPVASSSAQIALLETMIEAKNIETDNLINQYEQTIDEGEKQNIVSSLKKSLTERKKNLLSLLKLSSLSVYNKSFNQGKIDKLNNMTTDIKDNRLVETRVDVITGIVNTYHFDDFENNTSRERLTFVDENTEKEYQLYQAGFPHSSVLSGTEAIINDGIIIAEDVADNSEGLEEKSNPISFFGITIKQAKAQTPKKTYLFHLLSVKITYEGTPPVPDSLGNQKILVLLLKPKTERDLNLLPLPEDIEKQINGEIKHFFEKDSYNKLSITGDVIKKWLDVDRVFTMDKDALFYFNQTIIPLLLKENIDMRQYERLALLTFASNLQGKFASSSLGKMYFIKSDLSVLNRSISQMDVFINQETLTEMRDTIDGKLSIFALNFIHELAHSIIGAQHASSIKDPIDNFTSIPIIDPVKEEIVLSDQQKIYPTDEYGNQYDILGDWRRQSSFHFNAYTKKNARWLDESILTIIDEKTPINREYTLHRMGSDEGPIAFEFVPSYITQNNNPYQLNFLFYFLEYRRALNDDGGLMVNIPLPKKKNMYGKYTALQPYALPLLGENDSFVDRVNQRIIYVTHIDKKKDILNFLVCPLGQSEEKKPILLSSDWAGNRKFASVNVFENDIVDQITAKSKHSRKSLYFFVSSLLFCNQALFYISKHDITVVEGNTDLSIAHLPKSLTLVPLGRYSEEIVVEIESLNHSRSAVNSTVSFFFRNGENFLPSNELIYEIHFVPSTEEYRNDLQPYFLRYDNIGQHPTSQILRLQKGESITFESEIINNSRNPLGNESSDFLTKWYIEDNKGNNIIPPFTQRHSGISPGRISDIPARLTFIVPKDLPIGDYKIILEVDSNDRLKEFNENNNIIWRYFSLLD